MVPTRLCEAISDDQFARWIESASQEIDAEVGSDYPVAQNGYKFELYPNTPRTITLIASWLVASRAYQSMESVNRSRKEVPANVRYRQWALDKLRLIRKRDIDVHSAPTGENPGERLDRDEPPPITVKAPKDDPLVATDINRWIYGGY